VESIGNQILSACLFDSSNVASALERGVHSDWFPTHSKVFESLVELYQKQEWNEQTSMNVLEGAGLFLKFPAVLDLCASIPDWAFKAEEFTAALEVLAGEHARHNLNMHISQAQVRIANGDDPFDVAGELAGKAELLEDIADGREVQTTESIADESLEIDRKVANGEQMGLPFPWYSFQRLTYGIPTRAFTPLMGRDGVCKSRLATFLAHYWVSNGIPILYLPFEDGRNRFISNLAATHGEYDMFHIKRDYVNPDFMPRHENSMERVKKMPIYIEDMPCSPEKIVSYIARYKRKHGIQGVVIDGLKDVILPDADGTTASENKRESILNRAAKKYDIAGLTISHINKIDEDRWISRRNITGSDNQNKSARMALILQDKGFPQKVIDKHGMLGLDNELVLQCAKASYGEKGTIALRAVLEKGKFEEIKGEME
jgi:replicative DNA helicase